MSDKCSSKNDASRSKSSRNRSKSPKSSSSSNRFATGANAVSVTGNDYGKNNDREDTLQPDEPVVEKEKINLNQSGLLAAEQNTYKGVVLKYSEPPEARKSDRRWRLHVFKGKEQIDIIKLTRQSAYLIGKDRIVADIPVDHPSCSKQHAAIQFRQIMKKDKYGESKKVVKPYIIDLESTNGTFVNGEKIPQSRYYELQDKDLIKFGESSREYVFLEETE